MRPLILRDEMPPDDAIVVVRRHHEFRVCEVERSGFVRRLRILRRIDVDVLCSVDARISRYGQVRLSTVGRLRALGFALLPTLARPHYDVVLPDLASAQRLPGLGR